MGIISKSFENKGFIITFGLYVLFFMADMGSTLMNYSQLKYLEANPLYQYGGLFTITGINICIMGLMFWLYNRKKSTPTTRFLVMNAMLVTMMVRIFAIQNNMSYVADPVTIEEAKQIAVSGAKQTTRVVIAFLTYIPSLVSIVTHLIWKVDHKVVKKWE